LQDGQASSTPCALLPCAHTRTHRRTKTFYSKKYGIDLPRFTHKSTAIVYASTREDDTIRYHSLHDNKYLQYFRGHAARVVSLEMSAVDDGFMSAGLDRTVRLWDLRAPQCRGLLHVPAPAVVAYDASGVVFAVGLAQHQRVLLYDAANFDRAPFLTITLDDPSLRAVSYPPRPILMTSLAFSPSGRLLLAGCSGDAHYVLDSFEGHVLAKLEGAVGLVRRGRWLGSSSVMVPEKGASGEEVAWTPDSKFVLGGGADGRVHVWDMSSVPAEVDKDWAGPMIRLQPVASLDGHPGAARAVKFNPRFAMLASAGAELVGALFPRSPFSLADAVLV
jgi:COMPASS component SWD2